MTNDVVQKIRDLWSSRRRGIVETPTFNYEVFADVPLRNIKIKVAGRFLPVEYYSVKALLQDEARILSMVRNLNDSRLSSLKSIFKLSDASENNTDLLLTAGDKFGVSYYQYSNKAGFSCVFIKRPSGDLFYQRLATPDLLSYVLSNQVGFLLVTDPVDGVYTSPDKQLEFSFVEDNIQIINDFSIER